MWQFDCKLFYVFEGLNKQPISFRCFYKVPELNILFLETTYSIYKKKLKLKPFCANINIKVVVYNFSFTFFTKTNFLKYSRG